MTAVDERYVAARRVLLDAIEALAAHRGAIIVAGAQAVHLRTGLTDIGIAPYTTDGDLALDPTLLSDDPELEVAMRGAGFRLLEPRPGKPEPGTWVATVTAAGGELTSRSTTSSPRGWRAEAGVEALASARTATAPPAGPSAASRPRSWIARR